MLLLENKLHPNFVKYVKNPEWEKDCLESIKHYEEPAQSGMVWARKDSLVTDMDSFISGTYLLQNVELCRKTLDRFYPVITDFLFGCWQKAEKKTGTDQIDPDWWHSYISWTLPVRRGIMWSSAEKNWDRVKAILQFMDEDVENGKVGPLGKQYYIGLRSVFDNQSDIYKKIFSEIVDGKDKFWCSMAQATEAILDNNANVANKMWKAVFKGWERKWAGTDYQIGSEPTFLYHFASWKGVEITIPEDIKDHIVHWS